MAAIYLRSWFEYRWNMLYSFLMHLAFSVTFLFESNFVFRGSLDSKCCLLWNISKGEPCILLTCELWTMTPLKCTLRAQLKIMTDRVEKSLVLMLSLENFMHEQGEWRASLSTWQAMSAWLTHQRIFSFFFFFLFLFLDIFYL
jgi:hypothetical protein